MRLEHVVELTTLEAVHHEVQTEASLVDIVHLAQERMVDFRQNLELLQSRIDCVLFNKLVLPDSFDSKLPRVSLQLR